MAGLAASIFLLKSPSNLVYCSLCRCLRRVCCGSFGMGIKRMSYQVLARKWRPKTFREMVGQEHVLKALINALDHNRLHHAYLFTGTRGVGKTTIARILAKCLNCEAGVSSVPCGQCTSCIEIDEGRFVDLIEVDAASRTKVEDTRELLENVQYAPTRGRYKVYLIDEVHMLSTHSFNALLKTLEEPPEHVKFLLATTDPQKLPATILSRCLQFNLKNMSPERIVSHLQHVLENEVVNYEEPALWHLGRSADGSMRDAMSLTDQAIAFGSGKLTETDVRSMLGSIDRRAVNQLVNDLIHGDAAAVLKTIEQLSEQSPDYVGVLDELLTLLHRIAVAQALPDAIDNSLGDRGEIKQFAEQLTAEDVQLFYQMALNGRRDLPLAPDARSGFEMVMLRLLAFKPAGLPELPSKQKKTGSVEVPAEVKKPEEVLRTNPTGLSPKPQATTVTQKEATSPTPQKPQVNIKNKFESIDPDIKKKKLPENNQGDADKSIQRPAVTAKATLSHLSPDQWLSQFDSLGFGGVLGNIVSHCLLEKIEGNRLSFLLDETNATLWNGSYTQKIEQHLIKVFNERVHVDIVVSTIGSETPAMLKQRLHLEKLEQAKESFQSDIHVKTMMDEFSATLEADSIQPLH